MRSGTKRWQLDREEVNWLERKSIQRVDGLARAHRLVITLTHIPTGISVEKSSEGGNWSKSEIRAMREAMYRTLYIDLEKRVARQLRIPGR